MEVLVIITPRVEKGFGNLDPPKVADEFDDCEDGKVDDRGVIGERSLQAQLDSEVLESGQVKVGSVRSWFQELMAEQVGEEVRVDCNGDHLCVG